MRKLPILNLLAAVSCVVAGGVVLIDGHARGPAPEQRTESAHGPHDAVLQWNAIMLRANANDYDASLVPAPDQKGPGKTARAFAIVHAAIFDAVNSIEACSLLICPGSRLRGAHRSRPPWPKRLMTRWSLSSLIRMRCLMTHSKTRSNAFLCPAFINLTHSTRIKGSWGCFGAVSLLSRSRALCSSRF